MYVKKFTSFCRVLKKMHTKENWLLFSASRRSCPWNGQALPLCHICLPWHKIMVISTLILYRSLSSKNWRRTSMLPDVMVTREAMNTGVFCCNPSLVSTRPETSSILAKLQLIFLQFVASRPLLKSRVYFHDTRCSSCVDYCRLVSEIIVCTVLIKKQLKRAETRLSCRSSIA